MCLNLYWVGTATHVCNVLLCFRGWNLVELQKKSKINIVLFDFVLLQKRGVGVFWRCDFWGCHVMSSQVWPVACRHSACFVCRWVDFVWYKATIESKTMREKTSILLTQPRILYHCHVYRCTGTYNCKWLNERGQFEVQVGQSLRIGSMKEIENQNEHDVPKLK